MANQDKETPIGVEIRLQEVEKRCEGLAERLENSEREVAAQKAEFSAHLCTTKNRVREVEADNARLRMEVDRLR